MSIPRIIDTYSFDEKGTLLKSKIINIGLSFDHSYLDASMANEFLIDFIRNTQMIVQSFDKS
jgi:hypothetical protein